MGYFVILWSLELSMLSVLQLTRIAKIKDYTQNVTDYQSMAIMSWACDGRKLYDTSYSITC